MPNVTSNTAEKNQPQIERRSFFMRAGAVVLGGIAAIFPFAIGLFTFADPLRRRSSGEGDGFIRIANLAAVPDNGEPQQFAVVSDRVDSWNRFPNEPIGVVYLLRKKGEETPTAFNAICPHAGCFISYATGRSVFQCPCHNSAFALDGSIIQPSPSPRPMDSLLCEIRKQGGENEVWVKFENFHAGRPDPVVKG
jgi:menaquinol-cytochrome c reductase iron-sulfur subunit